MCVAHKKGHFQLNRINSFFLCHFIIKAYSESYQLFKDLIFNPFFFANWLSEPIIHLLFGGLWSGVCLLSFLAYSLCVFKWSADSCRPGQGVAMPAGTQGRALAQAQSGGSSPEDTTWWWYQLESHVILCDKISSSTKWAGGPSDTPRGPISSDNQGREERGCLVPRLRPAGPSPPRRLSKNARSSSKGAPHALCCVCISQRPVTVPERVDTDVPGSERGADANEPERKA